MLTKLSKISHPYLSVKNVQIRRIMSDIRLPAHKFNWGCGQNHIFDMTRGEDPTTPSPNSIPTPLTYMTSALSAASPACDRASEYFSEICRHITSICPSNMSMVYSHCCFPQHRNKYYVVYACSSLMVEGSGESIERMR